MKSLPIFGILFLITCQIATAQHKTTDRLRKQVLETQSARFSAMMDTDVEKLQSLLADDLSYTHTTGWTETKSEYLETIKSGRIDYLSFDPREVDVRIYGRLAVLTGFVDVKLIYKMKEAEFTIRFLEVQREVNGNWVLVAWQSVKYKPD